MSIFNPLFQYSKQVTALANKKFPEDDDCTSSYSGRLTHEIFSVQSRTLASTTSYLKNNKRSSATDAMSTSSGICRDSDDLSEKMWSAIGLDDPSPTQPLPLVQKRENDFY